MRNAFLTALRRSRVLPIVRGAFASKQYASIAGVLLDAGIPTVEFTVDGPHALDGIRATADLGKGLWVGAGTVRTGRAANNALAAGARFLVSPGFVPEVASVAQKAGVAYLPGVLTPSEIEAAAASGCGVVKLFPARPLGPAYLTAIATPLAGIEFVSTGGITVDDAADFLTAGAMAVGLGGSLIGRDGVPEEIRQRAARMIAIVEGLNEDVRP